MKSIVRTKHLTLQDVFDYLDNELIGFETDHPDNEYQRGYEQALILVLSTFSSTRGRTRLHRSRGHHVDCCSLAEIFVGRSATKWLLLNA